jgi:polar amino acid transport system substrate-binding protein
MKYFPVRRHGKSRRVLLAASAAAVAAVLAACSSSSTSASSSGATASPTVKVVATVAKSELIQPGVLKLCADFPAPPGHFYSAGGAMEGYDIALGDQLGAELGLKTEWIDSVFSTIILAAQTDKCDMIWSGMSITAAREAVVSMIPYFTVGESFITLKGNPYSLPNPATDPLGFCGHTLAAEQGSYEFTLVTALSKQCTTAGKSAITITAPQNNGTALEDVMTKHADAWMTGSDLAGYVTGQHPSEIETVGQVIDNGEYGLAIPPSRTSLISGVVTALKSMEADGTYAKILKEWGQSPSQIPAVTVNPKLSS